MKKILFIIIIMGLTISCEKNEDLISKTKLVDNLIIKTEVALKENNWKKAEIYLSIASSLKETKEMIPLKTKINFEKENDELFKKGKSAYNSKNFINSLNYFTKLLKYKPKDKIVLTYIKNINQELQYKKLYMEAQKFLIEGEYKKGKLKLNEIPTKSCYYNGAQELLTATRKNIENLDDKLIEEAQKALSVKNYKTASEKLNSIEKNSKRYMDTQKLLILIKKEYLKSLFNYAKKANLDKDYSSAISKLNEIERIDANYNGIKELRLKINKNLSKFKTDFQIKYKKAYNFYSKEKFDKAITLLSSGSYEAKSYIPSIKRVKKSMLEVNKLYKDDKILKDKIISAIKLYRKILKTDRRLGAFVERTKQKILELYLNSSKNYLLRRDYEQAYQSWLKARDYRNSNDNSEKFEAILKILRSRAKDIYLQSYKKMGLDKDSTKIGFNRVIHMLPNYERVYKKAKNKLKRYYDINNRYYEYKDFNEIPKNNDISNKNYENKENNDVGNKDYKDRENNELNNNTQENNYGYLSLMSIPNCKIKIDGVGNSRTPLVHFKLTVGKHKIQLSNKKKGIDDTFYIKINKGKVKPLIKRYQ